MCNMIMHLPLIINRFTFVPVPSQAVSGIKPADQHLEESKKSLHGQPVNAPTSYHR